MKLYVSLIHYPVYNKHREIVATSLTTLDIHDIARACATFGVKRYYIVQPIENHIWLAEKLLSFWNSECGRNYNVKRWRALKLVKAVPYFEDALLDVESIEHGRPKVVSTSSKKYDGAITYEALRDVLRHDVVMLCFGTGWGLTEEFIETSDYILEPIYGVGSYNHLSVRSAASIILYRLCCGG